MSKRNPQGTAAMQCATRRPSGHIASNASLPPPPPQAGGNSKPEQPGALDVFLHFATYLKIIIPIVVTIFAGVSVILYNMAENRAHIADKAIHVRSESRKEAKAARVEMIKQLSARHDNAIKEVKLDQREQVQKLGRKMQHEQRLILREVVRARRAAER
jgi:hypothetical protein